ncbi:MAG: hypothetical protein HRT73_06360, partial [Flavobacteriales bacterium]|nr:hypothetical protein [Flavobacteriales bacterium]
DIDVKRYFGYVKGDLNITGVIFRNTDTQVIYNVADIPEDMYLELSVDVERYYELTPNQYWNVRHATTINTKNELAITWDYFIGAESFDLEWVFVDISPDINNATPKIEQIEQFAQEYDWDNATRINTTTNFYNISMAYPSGVIIYRVRPVGVDVANNNLEVKINGDWSYNPFTFLSNQALSQGKAFAYEGLDNTKNWTYNVAYAEDGKRKEGISYFDGSARSRQEVTILNSDQNAIVGETMYDYEGRPALSLLPTPVLSKGIGFYENIAGVPFNDTYNKNSFDKDEDFDVNVSGFGADPMITNSLTNKYYSSNNTSTSLFKDYVPNANGFPFSRTTYKRDGTNRITEQSGVGDLLMHGTENTTKYYYGSPADMEIERLFGNEVGPVSFYQKNMVKDPNGQLSVQYLDKEGRTIATSLAGDTPTALLDLDYKPNPVNIVANLLANNNNTPNESSSMHVLTISKPGGTLVEFNYTLNPIDYNSCLLIANNTFNATYTMDIKVLDENGVDLTLSQIATPTGPFSYTITENNASTLSPPAFTLNLDLGTYTIVKTLKIDNVKRQDYLSLFREELEKEAIEPGVNTNNCVTFTTPDLVGCNTGCVELCAEAFREMYTKLSGVDTTVYYDTDGNTADGNGDYDINDYDDFVAECLSSCEEAQEDEPAPNLCELKLNAMKQQMSPSGQYFDNITTGIDATPGIDVWLETNVDMMPPSTIFDTYTSWSTIRADWNQAPWSAAYPNWMDDFVEYHPEYCAYNYNCVADIDQSISGGTSCIINREELLTYDHYLMSGSDYSDREKTVDITGVGSQDKNDFMNPFKKPNSSINNVLSPGINVSHSDYINEVESSTTYGLNDIIKDPLLESCLTFIDFDGVSKNAETYIKNKLQDFLPVVDPVTLNIVYHSIWYVLDDPAEIHKKASATAANVPQEVFDFYNNLHGNDFPGGGVLNPLTGQPYQGVLDNGTNSTSPDLTKQNKYQYFRGVYKYYRDYVLYQLLLNDPNACYDFWVKENPNQNTSYYPYLYWNGDVVNALTSLAINSYNSTRDQTYLGNDDGFVLVWPRNLVFDQYGTINSSTNAITLQTQVSASGQILCEDDCENNADVWMNQYDACIVSTGLTGQALLDLKDDIRIDLKAVCNIGCNQTPANSGAIIGSSEGNGVNGNQGTLYIPATGQGNGSVGDFLYSFEDVINHYTTGCTETVVYPPTRPNIPGVNTSCNCTNLTDYAVNTLGITLPFTVGVGGTYEQTAIALTILVPNITYTETDVKRWDDYCQGNVGDIIDFPEILECIDCKCENLEVFITASFPTYDPYNLSLAEATNVINKMYDEYAPIGVPIQIISAAGFIVMMDKCGDAPTTLNPEFVGLLDIFRCNGGLETTDPEQDCEDELNNDIYIAYLQQWQQEVDDAVDNFYDEYTAKCMEDILTRETFTAEYEINEYMFTLYYYDQAGNLIKTVPPEGVKPESTLTTNQPFYDAIKDYRANPLSDENLSGDPHQNVQHTMITHYKYDSYNNLVKQVTPDGGETNFWYDKLGRLVLSQNAKQVVMPSYVYSYTLYDKLGRIYEVGEVVSANQINGEFNNYEGEFIPWITDVTAVRRQVTQTYYDEQLNTQVGIYYSENNQKELDLLKKQKQDLRKLEIENIEDDELREIAKIENEKELREQAARDTITDAETLAKTLQQIRIKTNNDLNEIDAKYREE